MMNREELKEYFSKQDVYSHIIRYRKEIMADVYLHTSFLDNIYKNISPTFRIKTLLQDIDSEDDIPKCFCGGYNMILKKENNFGQACCNKHSRELGDKKGKKTRLERSDEDIRKIQIKRERTNVEKYGVSNPMQVPIIVERLRKSHIKKYGCWVTSSPEIRKKTENTLFERYGAPTIGQLYHKFDDKRQQTNMERYGGYPSSNPEVQERIKVANREKFKSDWFFSSEIGDNAKKEGMMTKFGADNYFKTDEFKQRVTESNIEKYGYAHHLQNSKMVDTIMSEEWTKNFIDQYGYDYVRISDESGASYSTLQKYLMEYGLTSPASVSYIELCIRNILDDAGVQYETNVRPLNGKEIDVFIPEQNLGIEVNGIYYHSNIFKENDYHLQKTKDAESLGIDLVHLFEDEITKKYDIVRNIILSKLDMIEKIELYDTVIREVSLEESQNFLDQYHIDGYKDSDVNIGLYYNDELVSVMPFQLDLNRECELVCFCEKMPVKDGFRRLVSYFISNYDVSTITTYTDRRLDNGRLYYSNGFELESSTQPDFYYVCGAARLRESDMISNLDVSTLSVDDTLSEEENMKINGYPRVYDCGSLKFVLRV